MAMSSTRFIHVEVATALAVTSLGPRARISRATAAGTMIVCAACRNRSTKPARLRQMSGDALTMAWSAIGQFSPERVHVHREGIHALASQGQDEIRAVKPGQLRSALLRNETARVPVDGGGETQIAGHFVGRPTKRGEGFLGELYLNRDHELVTSLPRLHAADAAEPLARLAAMPVS